MKNESFEVNIDDIGTKDFHFGLDFGISLRFEIERIVIVPSINKAFYPKMEDGYNELTLKVGCKF